jgi:hypothetical protein
MGRCGNAEELAAEDLVSDEFIAAYRQWHGDRIQLRPDPPSAQEIGAMERALEWPGAYLRERPPDEVRALNLVALARAREVELKDVVGRDILRQVFER